MMVAEFRFDGPRRLRPINDLNEQAQPSPEFYHDRSFAVTWVAVLLVGIALGYIAGKLTKGHRRAIARAKLRYR